MSVHDQIIVLKCAQRRLLGGSPPACLTRRNPPPASRPLFSSSFTGEERKRKREREKGEEVKDDRKPSPSSWWSEYRARCQLGSRVRSPGPRGERARGSRPRYVVHTTREAEERRGPPVCAVAVYTGYKIRCLGRLSACSRLYL